MNTIDSAWNEVFELVGAALELPPEQRPAFLAGITADDWARSEVASLVAAAEITQDRSLLDREVPSVLPEGGSPDHSSVWIGRRLGPYIVTGHLGEGGMGIVLLAERADQLYQRKVAIKVLRSMLAGDPTIERFRKEILILAHLDHPSITALLDAGTTDGGLPFLVMEYVDGIPITEFAKGRRLGLAEILHLVAVLSDALAYAHAQGVVHRDVKPTNVLVTSSGELKLLDFGIARLSTAATESGGRTLTSLRAATPAYASPEQIGGREVTASTDIYSVGVLLYLLIAEAPPFDLHGLSLTAIEHLLLTVEPPLASDKATQRSTPFSNKLAAPLDRVIARAMHPVPRRRYPNISDFKADLLEAARKEHSAFSGTAFLIRRWCRRRRAALRVVGITGLCALVLAVTALLLKKRSGPKPTPEPARRISVAVVPLRSRTEPSWVPVAAQELLGTGLESGDAMRVIPPADVAQALRDAHIDLNGDLEGEKAKQLGHLLNADYLLDESAEETGDPKADLRLRTRLFRSATGEVVTETSAIGRSSALEQVVEPLSIAVASVLPLKHALAAAPSLLPHQPAAIRWYAEGLEKIYALEPTEAQIALAKAVAIEPGSPLIHAALARAWEMLGYRQKAVAEAEHASAIDTGLPTRTKLLVEAQAEEIRHRWPAAIGAYTTLREFDPDEIEHVLGLARSQLADNQNEQALATLQAADQMPALLGADPRISLLMSAVERKLSRYPDSLTHADRALAAGRERGATELLAQSENARALTLDRLGRTYESMAAAHTALDLFAQAGDRAGYAANLVIIGNLLEDQAQYSQARADFLTSREIFEQLGNEAEVAAVDNDLGNVAEDTGDLQQALARFQSSLEVHRRLGDTERVSGGLNNLAGVEHQLGNEAAAAKHYSNALALCDQLHDANCSAREHGNLANILGADGDLDAAERHLGEAVRLYTGSGQIAATVYPLQGLAHVQLRRGRLPAAHARYTEAIEIARSSDNRVQLGVALSNDAQVLEEAGDRVSADRELQDYLHLQESLHDNAAIARGGLLKISFDLGEDRPVEPESRFGDLLATFESKNDDEDLAELYLAWTQSLLLEHRLPEAKARFHLALPIIHKLHLDPLEQEGAIVAAKLDAESGHPGHAEYLLGNALHHATLRHDLPLQMHMRLELARAEQHRSCSRSDQQLRKLRLDAQQRGFWPIAHQAEALETTCGAPGFSASLAHLH